MVESLREIWERRWLLYTLVVRDLKVKYRGSYFGFVLAIMVPVAQVAVLTFVFKYVFKPDEPNYSALLFSGILPWQFVQSSAVDSCKVVEKHRDIVRKIYFPREVLPLSSALANLIHFGFTLLLFIGFLIVVGHGLSWSYLGIIGLIVVQTALALGLAMLVAAANTFYHDLDTFLSYLFMLGFYASPIIYRSEWVAKSHAVGHLYPLYMLNPMAGIIEYYRHYFLWLPAPHFAYLAWAILVSVVFLVGGSWVYRRAQWRFPEMV